MTMQLALEEVAGVCGVSATTAVDYWNLHRQDAFLLYRIALRGEGRMLSEAQMEMAGKIFEKSNERARRLLESERMERDSQDTPEN